MRKIALSHTRDPAEIPFGEHGAEYVCLDMTLSIIKSARNTPADSAVLFHLMSLVLSRLDSMDA